MVDFVAVIAKAVDGLGDNRPGTRETIYDRARATINRQLDAIDPPVDDAVRQQQLDKLEAAIDEVERRYSETAEEAFEAMLNEVAGDSAAEPDVIAEPDVVAEEPDVVAEEQDVVAEEQNVPHAEPHIPDPQEQPIAPETPPVGPDEARAPSTDDAGGNQAWPETAPKPDAGPAAPAVPPASAEQTPMPEPSFLQDNTVPDYVAPQRSRTGGIIGVAVVLLLLIAGAVFAFVYWRGSDGDDIASTPPVEEEAVAVVETEPAPPEEAATVVDVPDTPADALDGQEGAVDGRKFTQRLLADGTEIEAGPVLGGDASVLEEGKSVAALDSSLTDGTSALDGALAGPATAHRMLLYEERLGQQGPTVTEGRVLWSIVRESPGEDAPPEPAIQAEVELPERGLSAVLTIKRNADLSLPASHLIEIVFVLTGVFEGNGIGSIQNFAMKETEEETGDSLIAVPAKITDSFFMIALNDYVEAVQLNLQLMRERNWIDLPIIYGNGRRALLTLEKGQTGTEVFNQVIRAWEARGLGTADVDE